MVYYIYLSQCRGSKSVSEGDTSQINYIYFTTQSEGAKVFFAAPNPVIYKDVAYFRPRPLCSAYPECKLQL